MMISAQAMGPLAANRALKGLTLQIVTMTVRMMKGDQALMMRPIVMGAPDETAGATAALSWPVSSSKRKMRLGCHTLRNSVSATSDTMAEVMSGSSGPM